MQTDLLLKNLTESIHLEPEEANFFCSLLEEEQIKRKGYLLKAGSVCRYQYFVVEGCLKVGYWDTYGVEHVVKFAVENWWALDLESFATYTPAFYTIQALENTRVLKISKPNMDIVHERIPAFEKFSRLMYQNAYIALQRRITQNLSQKRKSGISISWRNILDLTNGSPRSISLHTWALPPNFSACSVEKS